MRQGLLDQFPNAVSITVLAAGTGFYARAAAQREGLSVLPLAADAVPLILDAHLIVDGLDTLPDPAAALRAVRSATSTARLFALVAHAAYGVTLLKFLAGDALAGAHPLTGEDVDALFAGNGWKPVDRIPLIDRSFVHGPIPYAISNYGIAVKISSAEVAERLSTAAFFVVADPL
jgi:hypothetical protein